jgi:hypothetical protein
MDRLHQHNNDEGVFVGIEYEGPHTGDKTLFIKGNPPLHLIQDLYQTHGCSRLYFGAGRLSAFDPATVNKFVQADFNVTAEVPAGFDLSVLVDRPNLTVHCTLYSPGLVETTAAKSQLKQAWVVFKLDTGKTCYFFESPPMAANTFDGYPDDQLLYYKENT